MSSLCTSGSFKRKTLWLPFHLPCHQSRPYRGCPFPSGDTDGFINALQRFVSLRVCPATIFSDNGTKFRAGEKELRESLSEWNQTTIHDFLRQKNIIWKFNPPGASLIVERGKESNRKILIALLGQRLFTDETLHTLMAEVAGILNSRPLTLVSSDPKDLEPLTPKTFAVIEIESKSARWVLWQGR